MTTDSEVSLNQPIPRETRRLLTDDPVLCCYAGAFGGDMSVLAKFGDDLGMNDMIEAGRLANVYPPELHGFDRSGRRLDKVQFHPAYHALMEHGISSGYVALPWSGVEGGHVSHAAMVYLQSQVEPGVACPMTMSYAAVPAIKGAACEEWRSKLLSRAYDPAFRPLAEKTGATMGMAMTEKQGGSDVRANTTRAVPDGGGYRLTGHKWFCSAPMSDGFLTLAQAPGGLSCFLVPRWCPDGTKNAIHLMRLKQKLGNRSNASAEIEYHSAWAERIGAEGDGVRQIIQMVHHTRLDTSLAPAGLMRAALSEAKWWCEGRQVFQRRLIDQPLMRVVLADLVLDWEGATALGLRVAAAFDEPAQAPFARIAVALAKYLNNKRCLIVISEAMECLGGMGYTDDTPMPMLYREAPLNSIWEGSGNVMCLDVLRTLNRDSSASAQLNAELGAALGADRGYDKALATYRDYWSARSDESLARWFTEQTATLLTASILLRYGPAAVSDGYINTRVLSQRGHTAGAVTGLDVQALIGRV